MPAQATGFPGPAAENGLLAADDTGMTPATHARMAAYAAMVRARGLSSKRLTLHPVYVPCIGVLHRSQALSLVIEWAVGRLPVYTVVRDNNELS